MDFISNIVNTSFAFSVKYFGIFWQVVLLATFLIAIGIAASSYGRLKLGKLEKPEMSTYKWISIIMCTLLAGGGVFWAAAEPLYHFISIPPVFGELQAGTPEAIIPALSQSFMHWGFLAWAILGTLSSIVLIYAHYHKGMPLKPRTLLYPIFGEKILNKNPIWTIIDAFSIIAVAAGTIGPIGFLGLQASFGLEELFGIPNTYTTQLAIIIGVVLVSGLSALTGLHKGIQLLSRFNIGLSFILIMGILLLGPGGFIFNNFLPAFGSYIQKFILLSTYRGDQGWLGSWTVFFWGWFLGYGPMMAIFISRISRGRTIRELIVAVAVIAPIISCFWFTVVGGTGIYYELLNPGIISGPLTDAGMPAAMIATTQQLPFGNIFGPAFLLLTILFVATTGDSMSFTISMAMTGEGNPPKFLRVFWAVVMGVIAAILLYIGNGGIDALQSFIVVTAVPVSFLMLPMLWLAPKVVGLLAQEQGILKYYYPQVEKEKEKEKKALKTAKKLSPN
ncbi:Choline-glycine betaine transporter [Desulfonispora thiosulfatigenes DSM 11270]|uniref:Choline-glycine betaine transporter n=2 Tax=Desulfonispora thiosulfatigenes TaxID=83661 RepID=A0A1W1VD49_DESTI|nr:Choline-glycine betaine transporter [Desulfonispora thiosulfatigenes DSM 11270]